MLPNFKLPEISGLRFEGKGEGRQKYKTFLSCPWGVKQDHFQDSKLNLLQTGRPRLGN